MSDEKFLYKQAIRIDSGGTTVWQCQFCSFSKACCVYSTNHTYTMDQYKHKCPKFIGVEEDGIMCSIPNSMDFILSEN